MQITLLPRPQHQPQETHLTAGPSASIRRAPRYKDTAPAVPLYQAIGAHDWPRDTAQLDGAPRQPDKASAGSQNSTIGYRDFCSYHAIQLQ